jgi:S1-C subfamily serine protease
VEQFWRSIMGAPEVEGNNPLTALSESLAAAVERVGPTIVALDARPRVATSGVIWRAGVVVSTNHTVRRDEEITVTLHDGRSLQATLAGRDPSTDLAVLRYESDAGEEPIASPSVVNIEVHHGGEPVGAKPAGYHPDTLIEDPGSRLE